MNVTLLREVGTTVLDANGNGRVEQSPSVGQYWWPLIVGVSATDNLVPVPYAAVYHGSPGVTAQQQQFIDDTFQGSGDTSSVISGTTVQHGESIITIFKNGNPGATVTVTIYGQTSDTPSNLSLPPAVPGTRFSGHPSTEIVLRNGYVAQISPVTVTALGSVTLNSSTPNAFSDVRQYSSYNVKVRSRSNGAATAVNTAKVLLEWSSDSAGADIIYQDMAEWYSDSATGTFISSNGPIYLQDVHHGPFFRVTYTNESAADSMLLDYTVEHTSRLATSNRFAQQHGVTSFPDGSLVITGTVAIGLGATVNIMCPFAYGRASWRIENNGGGAGLVYNIYYGAALIRQFILAAGAADEREVILPKRAMRFEINAGGGATSYKVVAITQFDKNG